MGIVTVTTHPVHKVAPVLSDRITTLSALLNWENVCDDFFHGVKDLIMDNKKVSKVTSGLQNSQISVYVRNNWAHLHTLTFPVFMGELHETFLLADWGKDALQIVFASLVQSGFLPPKQATGLGLTQILWGSNWTT